jgi:hypothetical protein
MRHLAFAMALLATLPVQRLNAAELSVHVVWASQFDIRPYYDSLPAGISPKGSVEMSCKIIDTDGYVVCRVVKSTLRPDNGYSKRVAAMVGQTGRIDMVQTPGARVGANFPLYLDFTD